MSSLTSHRRLKRSRRRGDCFDGPPAAPPLAVARCCLWATQRSGDRAARRPVAGRSWLPPREVMHRARKDDPDPSNSSGLWLRPAVSPRARARGSAASGCGNAQPHPRSAAWRRCACRTPIDAAATIASSTNSAAPRNPAWKPNRSASLTGDDREFGGARACIHHPSGGACATAIAAGHALAAGVRPRPDSRLVTNLSHWTEFAMTLAGVAAVSCRTGVRRAVGGPRADPPRCRFAGTSRRDRRRIHWRGRPVRLPPHPRPLPRRRRRRPAGGRHARQERLAKLT
jgi:hypothetical protein